VLTACYKETILSGMNCSDYSDYVNSELHRISEAEESYRMEMKYELLKLNAHRSRRIEKTYFPDEETIEGVRSIEKTQTWLILTEPWCGDSAQNIPYICKIASENPMIKVRLLFRDSNPDIMDLFLTNGTRSIPILIAFDEEWNELFRWGSRPFGAKDLVEALKLNGISKKELNEKLHLWYAQNKGKDIINELNESLRKFQHTTIDI